ESGARLLQVHPLELAGRAEEHLQALAPDEDTLSHAFLLGFVLGIQYQQSLTIQIDVLHRAHVLDDPELLYASDRELESDREAASLLSVLVLEADGSLVPVSYGISRDFLICNVSHQR